MIYKGGSGDKDGLDEFPIMAFLKDGKLRGKELWARIT